jgi:malate dehydrogenase (quinone)
VPEIESVDVALIGGGIMSATLGTYLKLLAPELSLRVFERLEDVGLESSNVWNNAGTGHAALCELNYMPDPGPGLTPDPAKAIAINQQFQESRELWATLVADGVLGQPESFIRTIPHMSFVRGADQIDYLSRRFDVLKREPLFAGMQFSRKNPEIRGWAPLLVDGRDTKDEIAATFSAQGTDVDYGAITKQLFSWLASQHVPIDLGAEVSNPKKYLDGSWQLKVKSTATERLIKARFVFVGAGGWALKLLQQAGVPEVRGYGTFPVSGHFLRSVNPELARYHNAKVYAQAAVGAPPMSVPHLDTRVVGSESLLLFGPFAGIMPKFLKRGHIWDLPASVRTHNVLPYLSVAASNLGLVGYLLREVLKSDSEKFNSLLDFAPLAQPEDWELYEAGQRAQIIKPQGNRGVLQFGTEVISSADGSMVGLLGASPGASVSARVMHQVLERMLPEIANDPAMRDLIPSLGVDLNAKPKLAKASLSRTANVLRLVA